MASESTNDPILDLLFEELDAEERDALRAEIEGDPAKAEELESFELLMGRVREADLVEEVPASVHASIMDAARAGVTRSADERRPARRGPEERASIWSRLVSGGNGQIALVATVLIAGAFVFKFVDSGPTPVGDHAEAPLSEMAPQATEMPGRPAMPVAEQKEMEKEAVAANEEFAAAADEADNDIALENLDDVFGSQMGQETGRGTRQATGESRADQPIAAAPEEEAMLGGREPVRKRRSKPAKSSSPTVDLFEGAPSTGSNTASGITSKGERQDAPSAPSADKSADYLSIDDVREVESASAPAAASEDGEAAAKEPAPRAYAPPAGSPAAIQQSYDDRDFPMTLREANTYLSSEQGTATDRATVMQLKAASLNALGRFAEADNVYGSIQRAYPNFRPDQISQARAEISRRLDDRKAPSRKSKPSPKKKSDYDFADEQLESEPSSTY